MYKRLAKALIRLCVCAGWSEPLAVAHSTLLEILLHGSYYYSIAVHARLKCFYKGKMIYIYIEDMSCFIDFIKRVEEK